MLTVYTRLLVAERNLILFPCHLTLTKHIFQFVISHIWLEKVIIYFEQILHTINSKNMRQNRIIWVVRYSLTFYSWCSHMTMVLFRNYGQYLCGLCSKWNLLFAGFYYWKIKSFLSILLNSKYICSVKHWICMLENIWALSEQKAEVDSQFVSGISLPRNANTCQELLKVLTMFCV